jgi:hypothetical protein
MPFASRPLSDRLIDYVSFVRILVSVMSQAQSVKRTDECPFVLLRFEEV